MINLPAMNLGLSLWWGLSSKDYTSCASANERALSGLRELSAAMTNMKEKLHG